LNRQHILVEENKNKRKGEAKKVVAEGKYLQEKRKEREKKRLEAIENSKENVEAKKRAET
jgi:hypothetical protein